jgi:glutamate racemase
MLKISRYEYYATDAPERFRRIGGNFLKKEIDNLHEITIDNL